MANKHQTVFILKVLESSGWGSTASRETINENYFYQFINIDEFNENYFYQFINRHEYNENYFYQYNKTHQIIYPQKIMILH